MLFLFKFDSEMELLKERFAKLLLGEDMSGGGKGVSSALALSNAITNLAGIVEIYPLLHVQVLTDYLRSSLICSWKRKYCLILVQLIDKIEIKLGR